ncbi:Protein phosphatase methylesterase 1, partial [Cucurbita argyrosperma subsp. argyrosperma]
MESSSSHLGSLPENVSEDQAQPQENQKSVFASKPSRPPTLNSSQKYLPLDWLGYFDQEEDISIPNSNEVFHVYTAGKEGPVVFCLHGGGYSGLSFALSAGIIKEKARVVAMDFRGHGKSSSENDLDLSVETMCNDVLAVIKTMFGDSPPAIVLVGHSMGGSVAVHVAAKRALPSLAGLVVVDVVEGTAMASLIHMQKILSNRMQHFPSIEKAIEWSVKAGSLRNVDSARVSIPSTLTYDDSKKWLVTCQLYCSSTDFINCSVLSPVSVKYLNFWCSYTYRAKLEQTEQYWKSWYEGLSEKFLSCPVPKLLLLAGTDRLDRTLTIGQMQGKFQMVVVRHTGHAIQEDVPDEFSNLILNFISRNRIGPHGVETKDVPL